MRINLYSQELTNEVKLVAKKSDDGAAVFHAAQLILHSSPLLHHPPADDDRSAITFWFPKSVARREEMARTFDRIATMFRTAPAETEPEGAAPFVPQGATMSDVSTPEECDARNQALWATVPGDLERLAEQCCDEFHGEIGTFQNFADDRQRWREFAKFLWGLGARPQSERGR